MNPWTEEQIMIAIMRSEKIDEGSEDTIGSCSGMWAQTIRLNHDTKRSFIYCNIITNNQWLRWLDCKGAGTWWGYIHVEFNTYKNFIKFIKWSFHKTIKMCRKLKICFSQQLKLFINKRIVESSPVFQAGPATQSRDSELVRCHCRLS